MIVLFCILICFVKSIIVYCVDIVYNISSMTDPIFVMCVVFIYIHTYIDQECLYYDVYVMVVFLYMYITSNIYNVNSYTL